MAWTPILVRYGEIGIKSRQVRANFEKRLVDRIEEQLVKRGVEAEIERRQGRTLVRAADVERAIDALRHTFGIVSVSPAEACAPTVDAVASHALGVARRELQPGQSFALRVKRAGTHTFSSLDVAKEAASRILAELAERKPRVDLDAPDLEIRAEIRDAEAFVFLRTIRGPGGLPLGSQGRVGVLVDSPRAAHAAWLIGKRGSGLVFLAPEGADADAWLAPLAPWVAHIRIHPMAGGTRAQMYASAIHVLRKHRCEALVVADDLHGALANAADDRALGMPVFRPLVGYAGARYSDLCRQAELPEV